MENCPASFRRKRFPPAFLIRVFRGSQNETHRGLLRLELGRQRLGLRQSSAALHRKSKHGKAAEGCRFSMQSKTSRNNPAALQQAAEIFLTVPIVFPCAKKCAVKNKKRASLGCRCW
jgi:hypothetical protein